MEYEAVRLDTPLVNIEHSLICDNLVLSFNAAHSALTGRQPVTGEEKRKPERLEGKSRAYGLRLIVGGSGV